MANSASLIAARKRKQGIAARARAQAVSKLQAASSLTSPSDDTQRLDFPDSETPMAPASAEEFPDEVTVDQALSRRPLKRKAVTSDVSDYDTPVKRPTKKPVPKPKATEKYDSENDSEITPPPKTRKKPGPKPKAKPKVPKPTAKKKPAKTVASDSDDDIEVVAPEPLPIVLVFMIPAATSEGNQRVSITNSTTFEDAREVMYETIGCVTIPRKPTLAYKLSSSTVKTPTINLQTDDDWSGLITDATAKVKAKKDVSVMITVLPENYMFSLRDKHKKSAPKVKGKKGKMAIMDLENDDSDAENDDDVDLAGAEKEAMLKLEKEYGNCVKCGPGHLCKIDRNGNHVALSFPQRRGWCISLACGTKKVTVKTPPEGDLFSMFHGKGKATSPAPGPAQLAYPGWYPPPMQPLGFGMPGFPGYPPPPYLQPPPAPQFPSPRRPMLSSDPADELGVLYPSIIAFINHLVNLHPERQGLGDVGDALNTLRFFDISEIIDLTAADLGTDQFGNAALGDAQFLVKHVKKEVKRLEKAARRARQ
ncbi:hypothetical protein C8F04DRAFT_1126520 [Mycena alexandri]|uniref:Uncharacterized protein n=1 Tax=Mycena alexandri TaxID=1745969 RepID=A0AAD6SEA3_9AGAR|nr:hypothetical protein C8F04DRAFT_1126520 [Mycena alexandri]